MQYWNKMDSDERKEISRSARTDDTNYIDKMVNEIEQANNIENANKVYSK